jgi:hypothetical protein
MHAGIYSVPETKIENACILWPEDVLKKGEEERQGQTEEKERTVED